MAQIPFPFSKLAGEYPTHKAYPAHKLLTEIGGQVRESVKDNENTCAVRMSYAFNHAGLPMHKNGANIYWRSAAPRVDPATATWVKPTVLNDLYMIRVENVKSYLVKEYGQPTLIWDGYTKDWQTKFHGPTQGIVIFEWRGPPKAFGATGHADLLRMTLAPGQPPSLRAGCVQDCYFMGGPMYVFLFEMLP